MTCTPVNTSPATVDRPERVWRTDLTPVADRGFLRELLTTLGADETALREPVDGSPITLWRVREGATLLHEGAPAQTLYVLRSGSLKSVRTLEDGYEQVLSFAQPGWLIGFEALHCGHQPTGVVALEHSTVFALPLSDLRALRQQCDLLDHALEMALSRQLVRVAGTAEMMAAVGADVRLARFLLWVSTSMAEAGQSPSRLRLRMGRRDIASLLGVAHATVSRSFGLLADAGLVSVENRDVHILDLEGLRLRGRSTRGPLEMSESNSRLGVGTPAPAVVQAVWFPNPTVLSAA